jgi:DNA-binding transcriptional regulator YiaG
MFKASDNAVKMLTGQPAKGKPLLQRSSEAFGKSREEGRAVSFRVDVDPDGVATATSVEAAAAERETSAVEEQGELSADAFAALLGTTRVTVNA